MPTYEVELENGEKYHLDSEREPTQEEAQSAISQFQSRPTPEQSFGGSAARGIAPAAGGWLGGEGGAALGVALAPETGGLSLLLPVAGAIAGGAIGYSGTKSGQDYLANRYAPNSILGSRVEQQDETLNPYSSMAGNFLSMGLPNPASLTRAGGAVLTQEGRSALGSALNLVRTLGPEKAAQVDQKGVELLNHVLHIAGNSGVGVAQGAMEGQNPGDIALNTAGMMLFNEGWLHHPDHGVNTETFRNAVESHEAESAPPTPPEAQDAATASAQPKEGPSLLDSQHEKAVEQINSNPVAQVQDQLVDQLDASGAPKTAVVLAQTKEEARDMDALGHLKTQAEDQAEIEHQAMLDEEDRLQKEYEKHLKDEAAAKKKAAAGKAPKGAGAEPVTEQEVTPEVISGTQPVTPESNAPTQEQVQKGVQPERPSGDEGRKTTKAGGSNRILSEAQGQEVTPTQPQNEEDIQGQKAPDDALQGTQGKEVVQPKIIAATFENKGQTYEGATHLEAIANSGSRQKSRYKSRTSRENERFGFTVEHPDGVTEIVDRQKANELAQQNGQALPDAKIKDNMLHSDHLQEGWAKPEEDRPVPPLNRKDEYGVPLFESKEEFDTAYENDHDQEMKETPQEFLLRKGCE